MAAHPTIAMEARAALLIDADNFHDPGQLCAVHSQFGQHAGKGFICHVHGDAKLLQKDTLQTVWREMAARLLPCLPLNKNTADAALIIDALTLHFQQGVRRFGIVSGDADFAPLSLQLRELGCEVTCFARKSIAFEAMVSYYDRVVRFDVVPPRLEIARAVLPPVSHASPLVEAVSKAADPVPTRLAPVISPASKVNAVESMATGDAIVAGLCAASSEDQVLRAFPLLRDGSPQPLSQVIPALRKNGVIGSSTKARVWFAQFGSAFELRPVEQPHQVIYHGVRIERREVSSTTPIKSWPCAVPRCATVKLQPEMHALRAVLSELAARKVCVADILAAAPELADGTPCALSGVAGRLRERGLLRPNQSALRILRHFPEVFAVETQTVPQWARYLR